MPWDKRYEPKYDFSEKFKDKSTRELVDMLKPAVGGLREFFDAREESENIPREVWPEAPALWIRDDALQILESAFANENLEDLVQVIQSRADEVPRGDPQIATTLYGEFLSLLRKNGVSLPNGRRSPYGVIYVITGEETNTTRTSLAAFMQGATDQVLSDPDITSLILYNGEPAVVRRGIEHFTTGLEIPAQYAALVLIGR